VHPVEQVRLCQHETVRAPAEHWTVEVTDDSVGEDNALVLQPVTLLVTRVHAPLNAVHGHRGIATARPVHRDEGAINETDAGVKWTAVALERLPECRHVPTPAIDVIDAVLVAVDVVKYLVEDVGAYGTMDVVHRRAEDVPGPWVGHAHEEYPKRLLTRNDHPAMLRPVLRRHPQGMEEFTELILVKSRGELALRVRHRIEVKLRTLMRILPITSSAMEETIGVHCTLDEQGGNLVRLRRVQVARANKKKVARFRRDTTFPLGGHERPRHRCVHEISRLQLAPA